MKILSTLTLVILIRQNIVQYFNDEHDQGDNIYG